MATLDSNFEAGVTMEVLNAISEEIMSALRLDIKPKVIAEWDVRHAAYLLAASFKALRADEQEYHDVADSWWDQLKVEKLGWFVERGWLEVPRVTTYPRLIRMCPHIAVPDRKTHIEFLFRKDLVGVGTQWEEH